MLLEQVRTNDRCKPVPSFSLANPTLLLDVDILHLTKLKPLAGSGNGNKQVCASFLLIFLIHPSPTQSPPANY